MHDMLTARRAELVAAREQNGRRQAELRAALDIAARDDYAYAAAIGEIERLLEQSAPAPAATPAPKRRRGRA